MQQLQDTEMTALFVAPERVAPGASTAASVGPAECQGCLERPDRLCAACGAPARVWTEAGDRRHAVAWCRACHDALVSQRPPNAPPLVYLPISQPVPAA
jgi:hypothetical protein